MANKLMVVAHPDDESIFGGAQLIQGTGWKVVCVTNGDNRLRSKEFARAMNFVGADYEMWSYKDAWDGNFNIVKLKSDLEKLLASGNYTKVVTHNLRGEYGHTQHKCLAKILRQLVTKNLYAFSLRKAGLPKEVSDKKRRLINIYKSQAKTIQELDLERHITHELVVRVN
ncbi:PIG-L family deacetylase [Alicyclobacillus fastidiosus]|uniref:PIG-L family deacetylase n=1 Tax=Alicyclobacillus fastidiosus TaxID=392011 RepID=A0ABV5AAH4_9BACL|nr:PIG-L family deacetylase [Alicyclobacillus fastidiosus]WEH07587.1 PIG-L family deacetylase [Alicyclobacillus fastidiosus]